MSLQEEVSKLIWDETTSDDIVRKVVEGPEGEASGVDVPASEFAFVLLSKVNGIEKAVLRLAQELDRRSS